LCYRLLLECKSESIHVPNREIVKVKLNTFIGDDSPIIIIISVSQCDDIISLKFMYIDIIKM